MSETPSSTDPRRTAIYAQIRAEQIDLVANWLEGLANDDNALHGGSLGAAKVDRYVKAAAWRQAAKMLREHPEVLDNQ